MWCNRPARLYRFKRSGSVMILHIRHHGNLNYEYIPLCLCRMLGSDWHWFVELFLWSVDAGRYVYCGLLMQGGMFIVVFWCREVCLLWSVDTGRYVYCGLLTQGGMFIVVCWHRVVCLLWSVDAGRYVYCGLLMQGGMFIMVFWCREVCLLWSFDAGRYVYCGLLMQGGMFIMVFWCREVCSLWSEASEDTVSACVGVKAVLPLLQPEWMCGYLVIFCWS
jgi:hypothetical protein